MKDDILQRIIIVCKQKSDSETQFAKMIGANQKTINQQLRGERSDRTFFLLCICVNVRFYTFYAVLVLFCFICKQ